MAKKQLAVGIEFSTQSAKAVVLDVSRGSEPRYSDKFEYDRQFPEYRTDGGVLPSARPELRHTSPLLMLEALDLMFDRMRAGGVEMASIGAMKIDAMQHASVYLNGAFTSCLSDMPSAGSLVEHFRNVFSRPSVPIWEDRTTAQEAADLTRMVGATAAPATAADRERTITDLTGNRAELRFPAPQILRWAREDVRGFDTTANIQLLSAFLTSVLSGSLAPVDTGDGWGTNLNSVDINVPSWSAIAVEALDRLLREAGAKTGIGSKLGGIAAYDAPVGTVSGYFARRYGVAPDAVVLAGTGDNPATLLGAGGRAVISLGSSYTVNGVMAAVVPSRNEEYNVFGFVPGTAMALTVFTNGSKLHDRFLRSYLGRADSDAITASEWNRYSTLAGDPAPRPDEPLMLPYLMAESVPTAPAGIIRDGFDDRGAAQNIRSLHISQVLSLRLHSGHLAQADAVCIVGGGARNAVLRQMITDAFGAPTYMIENSDVAAPFGCAISAARNLLDCSYAEAAGRFVQRDAATALSPEKSRTAAYRVLLERYAALESGRR